MKLGRNILYLLIAVIIILMLIFGQRIGKDKVVVEEVEESIGSGFLEIETFPGDADIYVDNENKGKSPTTLYNIPVGSHNIIIRKSGYEDFIREVVIEAGKKIVLEERLILKVVEEEVIDIVGEEITGTVEEDVEVEEETLTETSESIGTINIGSKFLLYYDFSEQEFADKRNFEQDIFSKRYKTYLIFTRINPVNVKTIDKGIDEVKKEDCIGIKGQFEWLYSGQSLCVITKEGQIAAIGGSWEETEDAELTWKVLN